MSDADSGSTCWTLVLGAARGDAGQRSDFALRYAGIVRRYLLARWRGSPLVAEVDDAVQEVFVECYRANGALERINPRREGGFRPYLLGVVRNVARRVERQRERRHERSGAHDSRTNREALEVPVDEQTCSQVFDRAFAHRIMRDAAYQMEQSAREAGAAAERRVELLQLRLTDDLPIRVIAEQWSEDPTRVHREYALAREEFRRALMTVLDFYFPEQPEAAIREGHFLLDLLG